MSHVEPPPAPDDADSGDLSPTGAPWQTAQPAPDDRPYEIHRDTPCLACGYNLRGLQSNGRCPECGSAIADSLTDDRLMFAHLPYVRKLSRGTKVLLAGLIFSLVPVAVALLMSVGILRLVVSIFIPWRVLDVVLFSPYAWLSVLLFSIGAWLVTAREVARPMELRRWRMVCRVSAGCALAMLLVDMGVCLTPAIMSWALFFADQSLSFAREIAAMFVFFALLSCLQRMAERLPDIRLRKTTRLLKWVLIGVPILSIGEPFLTRLTGFAVSARVVQFALEIWLFILMLKYRRHLAGIVKSRSEAAGMAL